MSLQTQATSEATPPQNLEAEAAVLGAILVSREAAEQVADVLKPEYFYSPRNGHVFRCAQEILQRGDPVDILTVNAQLQKLGLLEMAGGSEYLAQLESSGGIPGNAVQYARLIEETAVRRGLLSASVLMHRLGSDPTLAIDDALDQAGAEILRLANERTTQDAIHIGSALRDYWDRIEKLHENPDQAPGVRTGYADLDRMTGGLQPGSLVILAARPSIGKTSLALNIAQHVAVKEHVAVAVFSLEMSRWELTQRLLCGEAGVDSYLLRTGKLGENDWAKIANAMGTLSEAELYIDDRPGVTALEMRAKARRLKMQKQIGLVVIDYVQLMSGGGRSDNRTQEVSEISRSLKRLSVELDIPVLALSQLSRAPEQRGDHRPQLSDLRESGCLTGDSLVYLPETGAYRPIGGLVGQTGFSVMALNTDTWLLEPRPVRNAFATGRKPIFLMQTRLGRTIRATANHKFLAIDGWRRLDEIRIGTRVAVPRWLTAPIELQAGIGAEVSGSDELARLATSDVYWDQVTSIEAAGLDEVYDLTVDGLHNFVVDDIVSHNSLEQDADVVMFLYREGMHNNEVPKNKTELHVAKHRNGPTGDIPLVFLESQTKFMSATRQSPNGPNRPRVTQPDE